MYNPFSLENKVILITGASSGIGRQCAISCSQMGANIILVDINKEGMDKTLSLLQSTNHVCFQQDITKYNKIENIIKDAVSKVGLISGFVHSAGIEMTLPLRAMNNEYFEKMFAINTIASFEIAKILSKKKYKNIENTSFVFISSIMSVVANAGLIGYCASKGALTSGVRSMAIELAPKNIRVNCVSPAHLADTEMSRLKNNHIGKDALQKLITMHPLGFGSKKDVANACIYLLSDASKWITGTNLIVDGGYSAR